MWGAQAGSVKGSAPRAEDPETRPSVWAGPALTIGSRGRGVKKVPQVVTGPGGLVSGLHTAATPPPPHTPSWYRVELLGHP